MKSLAEDDPFSAPPRRPPASGRYSRAAPVKLPDPGEWVRGVGWRPKQPEPAPPVVCGLCDKPSALLVSVQSFVDKRKRVLTCRRCLGELQGIENHEGEAWSVSGGE